MAKVTLLFGNDPQGEFTLEKDEHSIGRARDCSIMVDNLGVSRHHCSILRDGQGWKVADRGSNNGTFVNGQQVEERTLQHQDRIVLGKYSLVFDAFGTAAPVGSEGRSATGGMGSEMTMFVDPDAIKAMQEKMAQQGTASAKRMMLTLMQGNREVTCTLVKSETTIGKGLEADIPAKGFLVKPIQAKVIKTDVGHRIVAMGGWRSVRVNGAKVIEGPLKNGDVIRIAGVSLTYKGG